jgi:hypothetical protein
LKVVSGGVLEITGSGRLLDTSGAGVVLRLNFIADSAHGAAKSVSRRRANQASE